MRAWARQVRRLLSDWWRCHTQRCDYYTHYLKFGAADLSHDAWHTALDDACAHFKRCGYRRWPMGNGGVHQIRPCPTCVDYERRVRA